MDLSIDFSDASKALNLSNIRFQLMYAIVISGSLDARLNGNIVD